VSILNIHICIYMANTFGHLKNIVTKIKRQPARMAWQPCPAALQALKPPVIGRCTCSIVYFYRPTRRPAPYCKFLPAINKTFHCDFEPLAYVQIDSALWTGVRTEKKIGFFFVKCWLLYSKQTNTLSPSPKGFQSPKFSDSDSDVRKALLECQLNWNKLRFEPAGRGRSVIWKAL
jgi:hypothetical protein